MIPSGLSGIRVFGLLAAASAWGAAPVLRIEGIAGRDGISKPAVEFSIEDLRAMPRVTVLVRTGNDQHKFEGVDVAELLKRAGQPQGAEVRGPILSRLILITAHDGYRAVFSLPELDPAFTDTQAVLADRMDGADLPVRDGPLRLVLPKEKRESRWIRMVERIEIRSLPEPVR